MGSIILIHTYKDDDGMMTHSKTLSHNTALLHTSRPAELPHVLAVVAFTALFPAAGGTALAPHPSAPQG